MRSPGVLSLDLVEGGAPHGGSSSGIAGSGGSIARSAPAAPDAGALDARLFSGERLSGGGLFERPARFAGDALFAEGRFAGEALLSADPSAGRGFAGAFLGRGIPV